MFHTLIIYGLIAALSILLYITIRQVQELGSILETLHKAEAKNADDIQTTTKELYSFVLELNKYESETKNNTRDIIVCRNELARLHMQARKEAGYDK